jgi:hypothetical protein
MSRRDEASIQQAMAAFDHQLAQERDKGMADGARLFLYRFKEVHGCTPIDAIEGGKIAGKQAQRGLEWGNAAMVYIAKLEEELAEAKEGYREEWNLGYEAGAGLDGESVWTL